ncbi:hypothetical protein OG906_39895 (plasmid) [Streptomyces sp. NBC_01426]|uniref:hypothetical protein n=1 Tax=Streptomyces sp. NBC_01426 TaxID=2975866 RepID=UPI002E34C7FB|nr:hypothetical protein [Streptomyces sp. NBC_01426]
MGGGRADAAGAGDLVRAGRPVGDLLRDREVFPRRALLGGELGQDPAQCVQREVRGGPAGAEVDATGAGDFVEGGHGHVTDGVAGAAAGRTDLSAGDAEDGGEHGLDDDAAGEDGRSVTAGGPLQEGAQDCVGQLIGHAVGRRAKRGEELLGRQGAGPGIGHGRELVGQVAIGHPVGHRLAQGGVRAQRGPVGVQPVEVPAAGGGVRSVVHGTSPFGSRAVNSPQSGLPEGLPAALKAQMGGLPSGWASLP